MYLWTEDTWKRKGTAGNEEIKTFHEGMLSHHKEEEVLMSDYIFAHTFQIIGLGVIKHKTDITPFKRNDSYLKKITTLVKSTNRWNCEDLWCFCIRGN